MAALAWTTPARCEDRSLVLLFGPTSAEHAQHAAHPIAATALNWLKLPRRECRNPAAARGLPARAGAVFQTSAGTNFRILFFIPELTTGPKLYPACNSLTYCALAIGMRPA